MLQRRDSCTPDIILIFYFDCFVLLSLAASKGATKKSTSFEDFAFFRAFATEVWTVGANACQSTTDSLILSLAGA
jgi:hypothetical protein